MAKMSIKKAFHEVYAKKPTQKGGEKETKKQRKISKAVSIDKRNAECLLRGYERCK